MTHHEHEFRAKMRACIAEGWEPVDAAWYCHSHSAVSPPPVSGTEPDTGEWTISFTLAAGYDEADAIELYERVERAPSVSGAALTAGPGGTEPDTAKLVEALREAIAWSYGDEECTPECRDELERLLAGLSVDAGKTQER